MPQLDAVRDLGGPFLPLQVTLIQVMKIKRGKNIFPAGQH